MVLIYDPLNGPAEPDHLIALNLRRAYKEGQPSYRTGSEIVVLAARSLHAEKYINISKILYKNPRAGKQDIQEICLNPDGTIDDWPSGFCSYAENWLIKLLNARH